VKNALFAVASIAILYIVGGGIALAQIDSIEVSPAKPRVIDAITLTASGEWPTSYSDVNTIASVSNFTISLDVTITTPQVSLQIISPWSATASIGTLPRGTYTVNVRLFNMFNGSLSQMGQKSSTFEIGNGKPKR
jgi:hypothetical protein